MEETARRGPGRPRAVQRRGELVAAAAPLFKRHGYANVSLKDVAGELGLGASALYRHFSSKEELLVAAIESALETAEAVLEPGDEDRRATLVRLAQAGLDRPDLWILLRRESLNLPDEGRRRLVDRFTALIGTAARRLVDGADPDRASVLRARAVLACLAAPAQYPDVRQPTPTGLADVASDVLSRTPDVALPPLAPTLAFRGDLSRREELLGAAARVFGRTGYQTAALSDVAAECGVAPPSLYHYFEGKTELLEGILQRTGEWIDADRSIVLRADVSPQVSLARLLVSYVDLAVQHPELFTIYVNDLVHLEPRARGVVLAAHKRYLEGWTDLRRAAGGADDGQVWTRVTAALSIVNELATLPRLRTEPGMRDQLAAFAWAALAVGPWPDLASS